MKNHARELAFDCDVQYVVGVNVHLVEVCGGAVFEALIIRKEESFAVFQEVIHGGFCHNPRVGMTQSSTLN